MHVVGRSVARIGTVLGVVGLLVGLLVAAPAEAAKKTKPGPVTGLAATVSSVSTHFLVAATWNAYPNATKYVVHFTDASGTTFSPVTTTGTTWSHTSYAAIGTSVTVTVTVYVGKVRGKTAQVSKVLPDLVAPVGAYSVIRDPSNPTDGNVTVQQDSLSDNVTPLASITQTIDWGDGTAVESWSPLQTTITHTYPGTMAVYHPVVSDTDLAGNTSTYQLAISVADTQPPTGTFTAAPVSGYADWTQITLTQVSLSDDLSATSNITRVVDWGDGTAAEAWTTGLTLSHVYAVAGTYTPTVTATDEAGNSAVLNASAVTVTADTTPPVLRIGKPKHPHSVRAWRYVHGFAADAGVGVQAVRLKVIERRGGHWYVYRFRTHRWREIGTSRHAAMHKARSQLVHVNDLNHWRIRVRWMRKGFLVNRAFSVDNVGNRIVRIVQEGLTVS